MDTKRICDIMQIITNNIKYKVFGDDLRDLRHWTGTAQIGNGVEKSCYVTSILNNDEYINIWNWRILYYDDGGTFKIDVVDRLRTSYISGNATNYLVNDGTTTTTGTARSTGWKEINIYWEDGKIKFFVNDVFQHSFSFILIPFKIQLETGDYKNIEINRRYEVEI